jgi:phage shock protein C
MQPRLTRTRNDRMIAGVCGGLGHYFSVDPVIVRLIFVVLAITTFITPVIYPVLWLIMPEAGSLNPPSGSGAAMPIPPTARFDPMTGEPLPSASAYTPPAAEPASPDPIPLRSRNRTLGLVLLGIGGLILINNVGDALSRIFGVDLGGILFPVLLVGIGIYLLRRKTA